MYNKEIDPPYVPQVLNEEDSSNIDTMFTNEPPTDTHIDSKLDPKQKEQNYYPGFTFEKNDLTTGSTSGNFGQH